MVALLQDGIWPERFRRNYGVFSADAMVRLLQTRVFVLGCGGLGGHVASLLARLGVGGLRLCDSDIFEESNLNRQYFCTESTLGQPKAVATARGLHDMAGYLALDVRHVEADEKNLPDMLQDVDVALDCLDDLKCYWKNVPLRRGCRSCTAPCCGPRASHARPVPGACTCGSSTLPG